MIEDAALLLREANSAISVAFLVFLRIGTAVALLPAFGERSVPNRVRLGIALAFTAIVAPSLESSPTWPTEIGATALLFLTEVFIGMVLGLAVRMFVLALQTAGSIAAQSTSLSQLFAGSGVDPLPALGHLLVVSGLALAVIADLHIYVTIAAVESYVLFPVGSIVAGEPMADWGVRHVSHAFGLAFSLAAPFVLASLVYNLALGVINKAMPQLMVALVGAPAITGGTIILLALSAPFLLQVWLDALMASLADPFGAN